MPKTPDLGREQSTIRIRRGGEKSRTFNTSNLKWLGSSTVDENDILANMTSEQAAFLVAKLEERLGAAHTLALQVIPQKHLHPVYARLLSVIKRLHQPLLDVREVSDPRIEQELVRNFLLENSPHLANIPLCRSLPIFLYADRAVDEELVMAWVADLGFSQLDILRSVHGSWFGKFFATDTETLTLEQFWDKHRLLHRAKDVIGSLGILGASVSVAGTMISRSAPPVAAKAPISQQQVAPQAPVQAPTSVTINIYGLTNNIAGIVQAKTPEEAMKIIAKMEADAQKVASHKPAKKRAAAKKSASTGSPPTRKITLEDE